MINRGENSIDWKTLFSGLAVLGTFLVAIFEFSASSDQKVVSDIKEIETRVCRLEAVQQIGICKR